MKKLKPLPWKRLLYALIPNPGHCQLGGNYLNANNTPCKSFSIRLIRVLYQSISADPRDPCFLPVASISVDP